MKKIVLPVLIFFLTCPVFAKTTVEASVDSASATLEEGLTYTIQVKTDEQLTTETGMPDLSVLEKDFQIGSQYQSTSFASKYENGKFVFERSRYYRYKLFPLSEGKKTIPSFQVRAGGKVFKTDPITIEAVDSGGRQPRARNYQPPATAPQYRQYGQYGQQQDRQTAPAGESFFFIKAVPDKTDIFVGEQIIVSYYLYTRVKLDNPDIIVRPSFKGFIKEDLEDVKYLNFSVQNLNGISYNRALLGKFALYPLKAGRSVIDQMAVKAFVYRNDDEFGMGGLFSFIKPIEMTKQSERINVNVKALPVEGQPSGFSGAVGSFTLSGKMSAEHTKMGQPVSLIVRIKGRGNLSAIEKPDLKLHSDIELYESKSSVDVSPLGSGEAVFEYVLIPRVEGDLDVGPLEFSYFSPDSKKYKTLKLGPYTLSVKGGIAGTSYVPPVAALDSDPSTPSNKAIKQKATDIRYLRLTGGKNAYSLVDSYWYYAAYLAVILAVLFFNIFIAGRKGRISSLDRARAKAASLLKQARQSGSGEEIIRFATDAVLTVVAGTLNVSHYGERHDELLEKYAKATGNTETANEIKKLLNDTYRIRYSGNGFVLNEKARFIDGVESLIKKI